MGVFKDTVQDAIELARKWPVLIWVIPGLSLLVWIGSWLVLHPSTLGQAFAIPELPESLRIQVAFAEVLSAILFLGFFIVFLAYCVFKGKSASGRVTAGIVLVLIIAGIGIQHDWWNTHDPVEYADINEAKKLEDLGTSYIETGQWANTESVFKRALAIREKLQGKDHSNLNNALKPLSIAFKQQKKFQNAKSSMKRALMIDETNLSHNPGLDAEIEAQDLTLLADISMEEGPEQYLEAEELYDKAIVVLKSTPPIPGSMQLATSLFNAGNCKRLRGKIVDAEKLFLESDAESVRIQGAQSPHRIFGLVGLADVRLSQGKLEEAEKLYKKALTVRQDAWIHTKLAELYKIQNKPALEKIQRDLADELAKKNVRKGQTRWAP